MNRYSGILMPLSSLPSNYGIGTMGKAAYDFVDFLKASGQKYWQLLPLGPTSCGDSPYSSFSTFAGNPYFIDLDLLIKDGLLRRKGVKDIDWGTDPSQVDYSKMYESRLAVLRLAYERGVEDLRAELAGFCRENAWVENYALYMALKVHFDGLPWYEWPEEDIRMRRQDAIERYTALLCDEMDFYIFIQYIFFQQWADLHEYAHKNGIEFIGDVPIYVALDSADVWSEPQFFQLDEQYIPQKVAGVPPDAFTEDGQLWGNPLYNWDRMRDDGYGWWIRRIDGAKKLFNVIRIDHFRAFESYWAVPYGETSAKNGEWIKGPGMALVGVLKNWFYDLKFIAEDLGYLTPEVKKLLEDSGFPGMKILEFGFDTKSESDYIPHRCGENSVCYVGTHDNDTVIGWLKTISKEEKNFIKAYLNITTDEGWSWGMIRAGMGTASKLFVAQMQDVLELDGSCRMNVPGVPTGNWRWRMLPGAANARLAKKLLNYTKTFSRVNDAVLEADK